MGKRYSQVVAEAVAPDQAATAVKAEFIKALSTLPPTALKIVEGSSTSDSLHIMLASGNSIFIKMEPFTEF